MTNLGRNVKVAMNIRAEEKIFVSDSQNSNRIYFIEEFESN